MNAKTTTRALRALLQACVLTGLLYGCAPHPVITPSAGLGIPLSEICNRYNVTWQWDGVTQVVLLEYKGSKAKALVGSSVVMVDKNRISLNAPVRRTNSMIYVPDDFEAKVLGPFGAAPGKPVIRADWSKIRLRTIVLDPGHGGKDPGALSRTGLREKTVVMDIANRMRILLEEAGLKVIMTRSKDEYVSLAARTETAAKSDADLFVSIHANSNPIRKTKGMEVYYVKTRTKSDLDEDQRRKNEMTFVRNLNMRYSPVLKDIVANMMYESKVSQSFALAQSVSRQSAQEVDAVNRGVFSCRFFVVRNTLVPAILVEVGYLTHPSEERKLASSIYRQKLAQALARSILSYASDS